MASSSTAAGQQPAHRIVELPQRRDHRGSLGFAQVGTHIPFPVLRMFYLYGLPHGATRGAHAHRAQHQFLVMLSGSCTVVVDSGRDRERLVLDSPAAGLYVPPMQWLDLGDFTQDAVCVVLSSGHYDESDYIREYEQFRALTAASETQSHA